MQNSINEVKTVRICCKYLIECWEVKVKKVKISLLQAMEAHRVVRG
jgi:hypothetical protein